MDIIILRQVCVKTGIKQMSVSVCVTKNLGEKEIQCKINEVKKSCDCSLRLCFLFSNI